MIITVFTVEEANSRSDENDLHHICKTAKFASNRRGQQLVLYLALLSCSLRSVKLHVVLLFVEQIKKERKEGERKLKMLQLHSDSDINKL